MTRILDEMTLMTKDDYADVVYNSSRYNAFYHVGITDLYEGLQQAATTFVDYAVSKYQLLNLLQIIMLIASIGTCGLYVWLVLRPYIKLHKVQTSKVAGLLSHVPNDHCDVNGHTRRTIRRMGERHAKRAVKQGQQGDQDLLLAPSGNSISASQDGGPSTNRWV